MYNSLASFPDLSRATNPCHLPTQQSTVSELSQEVSRINSRQVYTCFDLHFGLLSKLTVTLSSLSLRCFHKWLRHVQPATTNYVREFEGQEWLTPPPPCLSLHLLEATRHTDQLEDLHLDTSSLQWLNRGPNHCFQSCFLCVSIDE